MTKRRERPFSPLHLAWCSYVFGLRLPVAMPAELCLLLSVLLICGDGGVRGGGVPATRPPTSGYNDVAAATTATGAAVTGEDPHPSRLTAEPPFSLRVVVRDQVTRRPVGGASVEVFAERVLSSSGRSGSRGEVLLRVPYRPGLGLSLLARMEGYLPTTLLWSTSKRPIFSSVTLLLLPQSQANIWLFEDSVLIMGKLADISSQPSVQFPKSLLTLPDNSNVSSLTAYLTVPQRHLAKDCSNCTVGTVHNKSGAGNRTVELRAVAAVSAALFWAGQEVPVSGPVQISLPLTEPTTLRPADTVPAWALNVNTGVWERQGVGMVKMVSGHLVWTYTASHLGYWVAAPLPSSNEYAGHGSTIDLISYHSYLLLSILGGTLAVVVGFLSVLLCHCGGSRREPHRRTVRFSKLAVAKRDQTTSTHSDEPFRPGDRAHGLASRSVQCDPSSTPRHKANFNIYVEDPGGRCAAPLYQNLGGDRTKGGPASASSHYVNSEEAARLRERSEQSRAGQDLFFQDKLLHIYNQPLAVIQASELFCAPEGPGCKSATFPRNGGDYDPHSDGGGKDGYAQTLPKNPAGGGNNPEQGDEDQPRALETPPPGQGSTPGAWGRYNNLLESSVSVPGTLNEAVGVGAFDGGGGRRGVPGDLQGISERTLLELARGGGGKASPHGPRAWFVSLEGKPAATVRHSIIELHGGGGGARHRPPSSNDTSLDSGVDMSETPLGGAPRDPAERERPYSMRAFSFGARGGRGRCSGEDQDLSSSESGTTATCTPEDPGLRNILDGSSGAIPNIPEERDGVDTSSAQEDSESRATPPPRRLRKVREKGRAERRSGRHIREDRHLTKQSK